VRVYEALLEKARVVLQRASWFELEPEDLASTVYLRLLHPLERKRTRLIDRVRSADCPDAYVMRVVQNAALDEARRQCRLELRQDVTQECGRDASAESGLRVEIEHTASELFDALGRLNANQRAAVLGRLAGSSITEIATAQGRKYATVASDLSRGLTQLREILSGTEVEISQALATRISEVAKNVAKSG